MNPEGTETFEAGGVKYTAVFGFRAMKEVETHFDLPFLQAIQQAMPSVSPADMDDKAKLFEAASNVRFAHLAVLFGAALMKHHPDLTESQVEDLLDEIGLNRAGGIIGKTVSAALVQEGDAGSPKNPPKRSPVSRKR